MSDTLEWDFWLSLVLSITLTAWLVVFCKYIWSKSRLAFVLALVAFVALAIGVLAKLNQSFPTRWHGLAIVLTFFYTLLGSGLVTVGPSKLLPLNTQLTGLKICLGPIREHGLLLTLSGQKPADFTFEQLDLNVEGDELWKAVGKIVSPSVISMAKLSFLPLALCPKFMNAASFAKGTADFTARISIGTKENGTFGLSRKTLTEKLHAVLSDSDPVVFLQFVAPPNQIVFELKIPASVLCKAVEDNNPNVDYLSSCVNFSAIASHTTLNKGTTATIVNLETNASAPAKTGPTFASLDGTSSASAPSSSSHANVPEVKQTSEFTPVVSISHPQPSSSPAPASDAAEPSPITFALKTTQPANDAPAEI